MTDAFPVPVLHLHVIGSGQKPWHDQFGPVCGHMCSHVDLCQECRPYEQKTDQHVSSFWGCSLSHLEMFVFSLQWILRLNFNFTVRSDSNRCYLLCCCSPTRNYTGALHGWLTGNHSTLPCRSLPPCCHQRPWSLFNGSNAGEQIKKRDKRRKGREREKHSHPEGHEKTVQREGWSQTNQ